MASAFLRSRSGAVLGLLILAASLSSRPAFADDRTERLVVELKNNEDFRVRTQAALALGASKEKKAVDALCAGLDDANTTVRAAAAAAMGKLALGGIECLKSHLESETNVSVKSVIQKAMDSVKVGQRPLVTLTTKYYVAIGPTTDKSGRSGPEVDDMVRKAIEAASSALDGCVVAPRDESPADAKSVVARFKQLRTYFLWPKVLPPDYAGGKLTVKFEVAVFTYPGKALKGTIPLKLTMPDVSSVDRETENDLIKRAAESAFERFATNADRFAE